MSKNKQEDLEALENLENEAKGFAGTNLSSERKILNQIQENFDEKPNIVDGYKILERDDMPQNGVLYPESWSFAYRCPTSKEVANFSTINEQDQPGIIIAIEDLIRKCVVIYDTDKNRLVSSGQINDAHRTFFLLLIRDFYLPGNPIEYPIVCSLCHEPMQSVLGAQKLKYDDISEKLLSAFDGRSFSLIMPNLDEPINFLLPTIEISSRIFRYIVSVYRNNKTDKENTDDKIVYNKQFLLIAPYLYERGNETVKELINKFKKIQEDDNKFKAYLEIAVKLKLDNLEYINNECGSCGSLEETQIRFPGGWKNMFINKKDTTGYFN